MRKILIYLLITLFSVSLLMGCAAMVVTPANGLIYTDVKAPVTATANPSYSKTGTASCTSILGLIATGDASTEAAMKKGGITKVHHIDYSSKNILGLYAKFTVIVYGE